MQEMFHVEYYCLLQFLAGSFLVNLPLCHCEERSEESQLSFPQNNKKTTIDTSQTA
jgi:hypothetical protein